MQQRSIWQPVTQCGILIVICISSVQLADAQEKNQFGAGYRNRPTVSPYLSMTDNGSGNGALNYYNIVQPQQRARRAVRRLQNELEEVDSGLSTKRSRNSPPTSSTPITTGRMEATGHSTSFANSGGYFNGRNGGGPNAFRGTNSFGRNGRN